MLSKREFITILVIMLVVLVLFQGSTVLKDEWNDYNVNAAAEEGVPEGENASTSYKTNTEEDKIDTDSEFFVFIGDEVNTPIGRMVAAWGSYAKKDIVTYRSFGDVPENLLHPTAFLVDSNYVDFSKELYTLKRYASNGETFVFCNTPSEEAIRKNQSLRQFLGIREVRDTVTLEGVEFYDGFLLGGRTIYQANNEKEEKLQDLELTVPWYVVRNQTKTYVTGLVDRDVYGDETELPNEDCPAVIWRNSIGEGMVFVSSGDYMEDDTAIGILSAFYYELSPYYIYPVVNAQSFSFVNFAAFSSEHDDEMSEQYATTQKSVYRDVFWSDMVSIIENSYNVPTYFITSKLDYTTDEIADKDRLRYFMKLFRSQKGETGLSTVQESSVDMGEKLLEDADFIEDTAEGYRKTALYVDPESEEDLGDILKSDACREVVTALVKKNPDEIPFEYCSENVVLQRASQDGITHLFSDNIRLRSIETALGYSSIIYDFQPVISPSSHEDAWEVQAEAFASYTVTYWKPFQSFEKTTVTESANRIKNFLDLSYTSEEQDGVITLSVDKSADTCYFILRTHEDEIQSLEGADCEKIEDNAYLLTVTEDTVRITIKNSDAPFITLED